MQKLLPLESLRGIAALSVVIFHFNIGSHFNNSFTESGWLMVDFFFVLSGFVIYLSYKDRLTDLRSLVEYQKRRFWRLYPLHLVMLIVFLSIEFAKYVAFVGFGLVPNNPAFSINNLTSFLANLLLVHNWVLSGLTYNYPSWSISSEFYTYLIFAATTVLVKNKKVLIAITSLYITISGYFLFNSGWTTNNISGPSRCIYGFFLGVAASFIFSKMQTITLKNSLIAGGLLVSCVFLISYHYILTHFKILLPIVFSTTIISVAKTSSNTAIFKLLSDSRLVWLGTISYGVYMIHAAVLWILTQILRFFFKFPTLVSNEGQMKVNVSSVWLADLLMIVAVIVTIILASVSYQKLEKPFYNIPKKII